jgi:NAD+ kinase
VEERMMLETSIIRDNKVIGRDTALNDIVISRGALSRILHVKTYINDVFVDMFPGDGLIVSSPTGSTAYSLSAGGPIVEPDIDLIIVSPICPHILYSRSFITAGDRKVKAVIDEAYSHKAMVTVDGQKGHEIRGGDIIEVKKSIHTIKLIRINPKNFYNILRSKIYFRGESLKNDEV